MVTTLVGLGASVVVMITVVSASAAVVEGKASTSPEPSSPTVARDAAAVPGRDNAVVMETEVSRPRALADWRNGRGRECAESWRRTDLRICTVRHRSDSQLRFTCTEAKTCFCCKMANLWRKQHRAQKVNRSRIWWTPYMCAWIERVTKDLNLYTSRA